MLQNSALVKQWVSCHCICEYAQAAKLKAEVKEASLKAAKAAEEAEKKLDEMVKMVVEETDATKEEVESIVSSDIYLEVLDISFWAVAPLTNYSLERTSMLDLK